MQNLVLFFSWKILIKMNIVLQKTFDLFIIVCRSLLRENSVSHSESNKGYLEVFSSFKENSNFALKNHCIDSLTIRVDSRHNSTPVQNMFIPVVTHRRY